MLMLKNLTVTVLLTTVATLASAQGNDPRVEVTTNMGNFVIELNARRAPLTAEAFLSYVNEGHYDGTIFHRVMEGFVAQAGGFDEDYNERPVTKTIANESGNGLSNLRGTVGLARLSDPHSGSAQFYINLTNNTSLDPNPARWGYAVFGRVVAGMEVVDAIGHVGTGAGGPFERDLPSKPIIIEKIVIT